jgi:hypothetical protein
MLSKLFVAADHDGRNPKGLSLRTPWVVTLQERQCTFCSGNDMLTTEENAVLLEQHIV